MRHQTLKPKRRMTPTQRLDFERAATLIGFAIIAAAAIISGGGCR